MYHKKNFQTFVILFLFLSLVISGLPNTVQAAAGDPHMISGIVRDATSNGHTWPLYARIDIAGFSGSPIFSDPLSGAYSVVLEEGASYDFTVNAVNPGYQSVTQTVTIPAGDLEVNFGLSVEPVACEAQGYALVDHWTENFDGVTAPALPTDWVSQQANYAQPWVTQNLVNEDPYDYPAQSSPNVAFLGNTSNNARLYDTTPIDMRSLENQHLTFWMFQSGAYPNSPATLQVQVSTDNGQTWESTGPVFNRYGDTTTWIKRAVDLSAYANQTSLLVGFLASPSTSQGYIHIDTISLGATCEALPGALLTGTTLDANTQNPLNDVKVETSLNETISQATPLDSDLADGYYSVFAPAGDSIAITATRIPYVPLSMSLTLPLETLVEQDLSLTAGRVAPNPVEITQTVSMNSTAVQTLNLNNTGSASVEFILGEVNRPMQDTLQPTAQHTSIDQPAAGEVLSSFTTGLQQVWGLAYNTFSESLWLQDLQDTTSLVEDNRLVQFLPSGANTSDVIVSDSTTNIASDLTFNPITNSLWQPGRDTCIHEIDLVSRKVTGNSICIPWRLEAISFDPVTNTYFGSRNDTNIQSNSFIYRFTPEGQILENVTVSLRIKGMAYNPSSGHLFVTTSGNAVYILDVQNNYGTIQVINVSAPSYIYSLGIDLDCDGSLWVADGGYSMKVYEIASGESGVCDWMDIPWLSEDISSGIISTGGRQPVTLTFDAVGLMPGTYKAQINVSHNTPYAIARLPIAMTVTLAEGYGGIVGAVEGLEPCDANPAALPKALVEIIPDGQVNPVYTTTTDSDGQYGWASATNGAYTIRISADGFVSQSAAFTLTINQMQTQNFSLRRELPCVTSNATSINISMPPNTTRTMEITLTNTGAIADSFVLAERAAGASLVSGVQAQALVSEGFEGGFPPSGWQIVPSNSAAWSSWIKNNMQSHSGVNSAYVMYDTTNPKNEWLLTPEFSLVSGSLSFWSMGSVSMCRVNNTCDFSIWLVVGDPGGTDDIFIGRGEDAWSADSTWAQSTFDLTQLLPGGPVRIGFQYSGTAVGSLALDDIRLDGIEGIDIPWLSETPASGQIPANGGSQKITLTFNSTGLSTGSYPAILHLELGGNSSIDIPVTLNVVTLEEKLFIPIVQR